MSLSLAVGLALAWILLLGVSCAQAGDGSSGARRVAFNGTQLTADVLARLEQGTAFRIPDGEYWYDRRCGMVGMVGGPGLAYLAAGLDFCGPLAADASGAGTRVSFNGRYLHPVDLGALESLFGTIQPGSYWLDGQGFYGVEGGPALGNLIQEILMLQQLAMASGNAGAAMGLGGPGGSLYSHFPNLGAAGTGISVTDLGGGDGIVNAGGVMWWPGK